MKKEITLLACGPSARHLYERPWMVRGEMAVVNRAGSTWPGPVDFWFSLEPEHFPFWIQTRKKVGHSLDGTRLICHHQVPGYPVEQHNASGFFGSSSLYAAELLQSFGYTDIYLHGVDLTGRYRKFRADWRQPWRGSCLHQARFIRFVHL